MSDRSPSDLHPALRAIYMKWLPKCYAEGLTVKPIVTWRSAADQAAAENAGLSRAGAGQSPHNYCLPDGTPAALAFDFGIFDCGADGNEIYVTEHTDPNYIERYKQAGGIGKALLLEYGGDWTKAKEGIDPDWDHLELTNWKSYLDSSLTKQDT